MYYRAIHRPQWQSRAGQLRSAKLHTPKSDDLVQVRAAGCITSVQRMLMPLTPTTTALQIPAQPKQTNTRVKPITKKSPASPPRVSLHLMKQAQEAAPEVEDEYTSGVTEFCQQHGSWNDARRQHNICSMYGSSIFR